MKAQKPLGAIPDGLLASTKARSTDVVDKLRRAMSVMEREISDNDGLYPENHGRINAAEVCRRASVSPVTLHTAVHRETTRKIVADWLENVRSRAVTGAVAVRLTVTGRADAWKKAHTELSSFYHLDQLELVNARAELIEAQARIHRLEQANEALLLQVQKIGGSNVKTLPKGKR